MKYCVEYTTPESYGKVMKKCFASEAARSAYIDKVKAQGGKIKAVSRG